jgi:hypothetical protein
MFPATVLVYPAPHAASPCSSRKISLLDPGRDVKLQHRKCPIRLGKGAISPEQSAQFELKIRCKIPC